MGLTLGWSLITRDTVWYENPAAVATSLILAGRFVWPVTFMDKVVTDRKEVVEGL